MEVDPCRGAIYIDHRLDEAMDACLQADATVVELVERLEKEHYQRIREDLFELATLFARVCARSTDAGLAVMRAAFRRVGTKLLLHVEKEENLLFPALVSAKGGLRASIRTLLCEGDSIQAEMQDLHRQRVTLDDDCTETRLRLDARLVLLERHVNHAMELEHAVFARAIAGEGDSAGQPLAAPAKNGGLHESDPL